MIAGLDHVLVAVRDLPGAVAGYRRLLGREPQGARFQLPNAALELVEDEAEGMRALAFAVEDVPAAARLLERRRLAVEEGDGEARVRIAGLDIRLTAPRATAAPAADGAAVAGLDHFVIHTLDPDRAVADYAGRLGLDLRLDRDNPRFGLRQLWFRCGDVVGEVASRLDAPATDGPDRFGGLAWRVADPQAAHARLAAEGFDVSELRPGRKPGPRVFTVRDAPGGVPTLMIQPSPALESA